MPKFAHVAGPVPCPKCGADLIAETGRVAFQWGYCSHAYCSGTWDGHGYDTGDPIRWRVDEAGRVPCWMYFEDGGLNCGDPRVADLLIRNGEYEIRACGCGWQFGGVGVLIRGGRIADVRAYPEWPAECDTILIQPDGSFTPKPEWDDVGVPSPFAKASGVRLLSNDEACRVADSR